MRSPFGNKIHWQFWNLKTTAVCFRIKSKYKQQIIFQPSFYFFILQKCWNEKMWGDHFFWGDDKIPAKLVRLMISLSGDNSHQKLWDKFFQNCPQCVARWHFLLPFFLHFLFAPFLQRSISGSTCWKDGSAFSTHQLIDSGNWLQVFNLIWLYQSNNKLNRNQSIRFNPSCWANLSLSYFLFNSDLMKRWKRI